MKKIILFIVFFSAFQIYAQNVRSLIRKADQAYMQKDFELAESLYGQAIRKNPNLIKIKMKYADCQRLNHKYTEAAKSYKEVYRDFEDRFPLSRFYYAQMKQYSGDTERALSAYKRFYRNNRGKEGMDYYVNKAKYEWSFLSSGNAITREEEQKQVYPFDTLVNTSFGQYAPFWKGTDSLLYCQNERIGDTVFSYLLLALYPLNPDSARIDTLLVYANKLISLGNVLNKHLVFSLCPLRPDQRCTIWEADFNCGYAGQLRPLFPLGDTLYNNRYPYLDTSGTDELLFFSSDRPGGKGGYDIWYCSRSKPSESFDHCKNAGPEINSPDNEIAPYYNSLDSILWFSSEWFHSRGGFDIFFADVRLPDFSAPEPAPYGINSAFDDIYYRESKKIWKAVFASNRPLGKNEGSNCCHDLYFTNLEYSRNDSIRMIERKRKHEQKILQQQKYLSSITPLNIYFDNDMPRAGVVDTISGARLEDLFSLYMSRYDEYRGEFSRGLSGIERMNAQNEVDSFFIDEVEKGWEQLNQFCKFLLSNLNEGYRIRIEIKAWSSPLNTTEYNRLLAKRRIDCVLNFFRLWNESSLADYIDSGQLIFTELAIGEEQGSSASDKLSDLRNSVYNPVAARERRISIREIQFEKP